MDLPLEWHFGLRYVSLCGPGIKYDAVGLSCCIGGSVIVLHGLYLHGSAWIFLCICFMGVENFVDPIVMEGYGFTYHFNVFLSLVL